jgi:hypothetical protein
VVESFDLEETGQVTKRSMLIVALALGGALALLTALNAGADASSGRVAVYSSRTLAPVPGAFSDLQRTPQGLHEHAQLTGVTAGRHVTLVALVFNRPDRCVGPGIPNLSTCGAADQTTNAGPAEYVRIVGRTAVAGDNGRASLEGSFDRDDGVTNPRGAEVIFSFAIEGCGSGLPCANNLAVHQGETSG